MGHRLMAKTFLQINNGRTCVNHKDSNRINNTLGNLEWVTHKENSRHARVKGRMTQLNKLNESQVKRIKLIREIQPRINQTTVARMFNISQSTISRIFNGNIWQHITT